MKCVQVIDNPDAVSEQALLRAYAPSLSQDILDSLTGAFAELRQLNEAGLIAYPCVLLLCALRALVSTIDGAVRLSHGAPAGIPRGSWYLLQSICICSPTMALCTRWKTCCHSIRSTLDSEPCWLTCSHATGSLSPRLLPTRLHHRRCVAACVCARLWASHSTGRSLGCAGGCR